MQASVWLLYCAQERLILFEESAIYRGIFSRTVYEPNKAWQRNPYFSIIAFMHENCEAFPPNETQEREKAPK